MTHGKVVSLIMVIPLIWGISSLAMGQGNKTNTSNLPIGWKNIFDQQINALGKRLTAPGKEKTVYSGQLFDKNGKATPVRVIHQLPGHVRLEGFKAHGAALSFDGQDNHGVNSGEIDEDLVEIFAMDFPEGAFESVQEGAAVRLLGRGFGPDPSLAPDYTGPRYDIYEVTCPVRSRQDKLMRLKLYYFDTSTGLLQRTLYYDRSVSPPVKIETRFSSWGDIEGSAYPACIEHYEGGQLIFKFIVEEITGAASIGQSDFE